MYQQIEQYLKEVQSGQYSLDYVIHIRYTLSNLISYLLETHKITSWSEVTTHHLQDFRQAASIYGKAKYPETSIASSTWQKRITEVKQYFKWLVEKAYLIYNPATSLILPKRTSARPEILTEQQIIKFIESPDTKTPLGLRDRALMETLYATGIRISEIKKLTIYDVDTKDKTLIIRQGKGYQDRYIPLTTQACYWLDRYIIESRSYLSTRVKKKPRPATSALWLGEYGKQWSKRGIFVRVKKYAVSLKLNASVHTFRHCFATHLLQNGASILEVQRLLGHKDISVTEKYLHIAFSTLQETVQEVETYLPEKLDFPFSCFLIIAFSCFFCSILA
jgi:integrase/recombinase XerD